MCSCLRRDFRYIRYCQCVLHLIVFRASGAILGTQQYFTNAFYQNTLHTLFIKALHTSTLSKHFIQALYTSTHGDQWWTKWPSVLNDTYNSNYTAWRPCFWFGVACDEEGRIVGLVLARNSLHGQIPSDLGNLQHLQYLWVVHHGTHKFACIFHWKCAGLSCHQADCTVSTSHMCVV